MLDAVSTFIGWSFEVLWNFNFIAKNKRPNLVSSFLCLRLVSCTSSASAIREIEVTCFDWKKEQNFKGRKGTVIRTK